MRCEASPERRTPSVWGQRRSRSGIGKLLPCLPGFRVEQLELHGIPERLPQCTVVTTPTAPIGRAGPLSGDVARTPTMWTALRPVIGVRSSGFPKHALVGDPPPAPVPRRATPTSIVVGELTDQRGVWSGRMFSRAKYAAARLRVSTSISGRRLSRRRSASSSFCLLVSCVALPSSILARG
jgi:hypothetical protein